MTTFSLPSPLGNLFISVRDNSIFAIDFSDAGKMLPALNSGPADRELISECSSQISAWLAGDITGFTLSIEPQGTEFQKRVWQELLLIPYGETISYQELAHRLGDPKCIRAAASANGRNPIPIVIPCHRVIGKDGTLTGYSGGLWRKAWLLEHERKVLGLPPVKSVQLDLFGEA